MGLGIGRELGRMGGRMKGGMICKMIVSKKNENVCSSISENGYGKIWEQNRKYTWQSVFHIDNLVNVIIIMVTCYSIFRLKA